MDDGYKMGCGVFILFLLVCAIGVWLESASCHAKFAGSNLESRWGLMSGCRVKDPKQGWVPAENYRVL